MPNLLDRARSAVARAIMPKNRPPGGFSFGTQWFGGPTYVNAFNSRRAPTPYQLIENYGALIFAMAGRNRDAVSRLPLRLYADKSKDPGWRPTRWCDPIGVSRSGAERLARAGMISAAAVDRVDEVRTHGFLDVLDKPDPDGYFDRKSLIGLLVLCQDVLGSGFLVPEGGGWQWRTGKVGKVPEWLWVIYPQYVIPIRYGGTPLIEFWQYFADRLPFASTWWFRQSVSLRDPYGAAYSPAYAGEMYRDQEQRFIAYYDQLLGGPRPNLVASPKDPMFPPGEDERKRHEQDLNRRHSGGNMGNAIVTGGAYEYTPINYPPTDAAGKELSEYDLHRLASIFGQPPTYYTVDTNLANLQAADEQHARVGVEPRCWAIAGKLTRIIQQFDPRLFFAFDAAIQEDSESKEKTITMRLTSGRTTINQENEEDRWPAVPWGDEPWLAGTLKQPSMIKEQHEMGLSTAQAGIEQGEAVIKQGDKGLEHDGKRVEIEKQKAKQKPAASDQKRALLERVERLRAEMREAVA